MTLFWATMPYQTYQLSGTEAKAFLQGQLTQDINLITDSHCHYGAYCNHKGRMYANLLLFSIAGKLHIRLHQSVAEAVIKRLQLFILRADVRLQPCKYLSRGLSPAAATELCRQFSLNLPEVFGSVQTDGLILCALPNGYYEVHCLPGSTADQAITKMTENKDALMKTFILGGHFDITEATSEAILPQQTVLESWGGISYTKGCYVGQEIIARTKYRGSVKKKQVVAQLNGNHPVAINDSVQLNDRPVGKIMTVYQGKTAGYYQAVITITHINQCCSINGQPVTFYHSKALTEENHGR